MPDDPSPKKDKYSELEKRVSDLEDLVMVENMGIEELKNLMQDINAKLASQGAGQAAELPADLSSKLSTVDEVKNSMDSLESRLQGIESTLREGVGGVALSGKDMATIGRNLSALQSRMEGIETITKGLNEEMSTMRSSFHKFDSLDRASNLVKELRNKMDEFKFVESEIKRISNRVEGFYENLDKRLDKMREFERTFPELGQKIDQLREEAMKKLDEAKIATLEKATKDETSSIRDRLAQVEEKLVKSGGLDQRLEEIKRGLMKEISGSHEPMSVVNVQLSDLMARIVAIETRIGSVENMLQKTGGFKPIILE